MRYFVFLKKLKTMILDQLYTKCLAEATYYITSGKEAAIVDPLRETEPYLERLKNDGATLKYIFLTHFHADFVSGHVDLALKTGARIVLGPNATAAYEFHQAKDGEIFILGDLKIKALHTPGHTMESTCYLLFTEKGEQHAIFTGDTLFIGDVGRPDLAVKSDLTTADLAGYLYESLRNKIMPLDNHIIVYPAHGAGSACGKNMSSETYDTLGSQKKLNYALDSKLSKTEFVNMTTEGLAEPPQYFPLNVAMNKAVNSTIDSILGSGTTALSPLEFQNLASQEDVLILDVRTPNDYAKGSVKNAWFIGLDGTFAPWVGALIEDIHQKIILIAPGGREAEAVTRMARVGYDNTLGYLSGGMAAWEQAGFPVEKTGNISAQEFVDGIQLGEIKNPLDVRKTPEYDTKHIEDIALLPLDDIHKKLSSLQPQSTYHVHCAGGYRSMIFSSIAKSKGYLNMVNVEGGFGAIKKTNLKSLNLVSTSTIDL